MCGRYYVESGTWDAVEADFPALKGYHAKNHAGDVAPSMLALSLCAGIGSEIKPAEQQWGFPGYDGKKLIINARAEGISEKRTFADSIRERRCVLPAAGFYEWDRSRQKVSFTRNDRSVIYLAGIWKPYGEVERFVIITREANESMLPVHDRMPLMIDPRSVKDWLFNPAATAELLRESLPQLDPHRDYEQLSLF